MPLCAHGRASRRRGGAACTCSVCGAIKRKSMRCPLGTARARRLRRQVRPRVPPPPAHGAARREARPRRHRWRAARRKGRRAASSALTLCQCNDDCRLIAVSWELCRAVSRGRVVDRGWSCRASVTVCAVYPGATCVPKWACRARGGGECVWDVMDLDRQGILFRRRPAPSTLAAAANAQHSTAAGPPRTCALARGHRARDTFLRFWQRGFPPLGSVRAARLLVRLLCADPHLLPHLCSGRSGLLREVVPRRTDECRAAEAGRQYDRGARSQAAKPTARTRRPAPAS